MKEMQHCRKKCFGYFSCWLCYFLSCLHTCVKMSKKNGLFANCDLGITFPKRGLHLGGGEGREEEYRDVAEHLRRKGRTVHPG